MSYVSLELAKKHLLVIHDSDDDLIQQNIDAAEVYAADYMNRQRIEDNPVNTWVRNSGTVAEWKLPLDRFDYYRCVSSEPAVSSEPYDPVPPSVVQAILLLVGDYYENRTAGIVGTIHADNPAVINLLNFHRIGLGI